MFADISGTYDFMNSAMSFRLHHRWRKFAVSLLDLKLGESVLDVCCGTGDFAIPVRKQIGKDGVLLGIDFCPPMLMRASQKKMPMELATGDACRLPIMDSSADAITIGWGLRNVPDLETSLKEIFRVLKPGGRWVSVDMAVPKGRFSKWFSKSVLTRGLPLFGSLLGKKKAYEYLPKSTLSFATREEQLRLMKEIGFRNCKFHDLFFGTICVHFGEK